MTTAAAAIARVVAGAGLLVAPACGAQLAVQGALGATAARATYEGFLTSQVWSANATLGATYRSLGLVFRGVGSRFETSHLSGDVDGVLSYGRALRFGWRLDAAGAGGASWYRVRQPSSSAGAVVLRFAHESPVEGLRTSVREALVRLSGPVQAEAGAPVTQWVTQGDISFWHRLASTRSTLAASVLPSRVGRWRYTDGGLELGVPIGAAQLSLRGGARVGGDDLGDRWLIAEARTARWHGWSLHVSGGEQPSDLERAAPASHFFAGGLTTEFGGTLRNVRLPRDRHRPVVSLEDGDVVAVASRGYATIMLRIPSASATDRVEITGDVTDWVPRPMESAGRTWRVTVPATPGLYRVAVRINGGPWLVPPGLTAERDDFGGMVGLLIVH